MRYLIIAGIMLLMSCEATETKKKEVLVPEQELRESIKDLEPKVFGNDAKMNATVARQLQTLYVGFVNNNPTNDTAAEYLYRAGEILMGLKDYDESIATFERLVSNYPEFEKAPQAAYLKAFINDEHLYRKGKAKELYQEMIDKYPRHPLANDARASIKLLGMSEEEILKMLEEKNKETPPES